MKKKVFGILLCLLVAVLVTGCDNKKEEKKEKTGFYIENIDKDNDGLPDGGAYRLENGKIMKGEEIIYDPDDGEKNFIYDITEYDKIPNKDKLDQLEVVEYLKPLKYEIYMDSYEKITEENIHHIIFAASIPYMPMTDKKTISELAKRYLDIDNYDLPAGTYHSNRLGIVTVLRYNDVYIFDTDPSVPITYEMKMPIYSTNDFKTFEQKGNELILSDDLMDFDVIDETNTMEIFKLYGTQTMYLEFTDNGLKIKKVEFVSNE